MDKPRVPSEQLERWQKTDERKERLFDLEVAHVDGYTLVYEDERLRDQIKKQSGNNLSRVFFATKLKFFPRLPPGAGRIIKSKIVSEVKKSVAERFQQQGFEQIDTGKSKGMSVNTGAKATLIPYTGKYNSNTVLVPAEGYTGVWRDERFIIAGGAYPTDLEPVGLDKDTKRYRDELLELIKYTA